MSYSHLGKKILIKNTYKKLNVVEFNPAPLGNCSWKYFIEFVECLVFSL